MRKLAGNSVLASLALAAAVGWSAPAAHADGLLDSLFGGPIRRGEGRNFPAAPPPPSRAQVKALGTKAEPVKISAPTYRDYRPDALIAVDFRPLAAAAQTASAESPAAAPAASAFRQALGGLDGFELLAERDVAKALVDYYSAHPDFIWVSDGAPNERARQALAAFADAGSYGLVPAEYTAGLDLPEPAGAQAVEPSSDDLSPAGQPMVERQAASNEQDLIRFELALSARALRYTHDAASGRVVPDRMSEYYDLPEKPLDLVAALGELAAAPDAGAWLESRHPDNREYRELRQALAEVRAGPDDDFVAVDPKLLLKPGQTSPELPKVLAAITRDMDDVIRAEYGETLEGLAGSETYTDELKPVIEAVQKRKGLKPDGVIGPATVAALVGVSKADKIAKLTYALEELRWHPADLGSTRVFINQPAFTAAYVENDREVLKMRAVVGKVSNQTSFFYDEIEQVDYNPYWGVPQSIIVNEMLPRLRNDPGYLDRAGYEVTDSGGKRIASSSIDWSAYGGKVPFNVRQLPSEANALGELKILFPNKHAIYMHDTPEKSLFKRDMRAFSHGCVRLENPRGMAAAVLGKDVDYIAQKVKQGHSSEKVARKIPVYVAYFTAWPDDSGAVEYFSDIYGRDARLQQAMDKTGAVRLPDA